MRRVTVEGSEAAIINQFGDIAIIPVNKVAGIKSMLERGCDTCIDRIVNKLPSVGNTAEDGMALPNISFSDVADEVYGTLQSMGFSEEEIGEVLAEQDDISMGLGGFIDPPKKVVIVNEVPPGQEVKSIPKYFINGKGDIVTEEGSKVKNPDKEVVKLRDNIISISDRLEKHLSTNLYGFTSEQYKEWEGLRTKYLEESDKAWDNFFKNPVNIAKKVPHEFIVEGGRQADWLKERGADVLVINDSYGSDENIYKAIDKMGEGTTFIFNGHSSSEKLNGMAPTWLVNLSKHKNVKDMYLGSCHGGGQTCMDNAENFVKPVYHTLGDKSWYGFNAGAKDWMDAFFGRNNKGYGNIINVPAVEGVHYEMFPNLPKGQSKSSNARPSIHLELEEDFIPTTRGEVNIPPIPTKEQVIQNVPTMEEGGVVEGTAEPQRSSRPGYMLNMESEDEPEELATLRKKYQENEEEKNRILNEIMFLPEATEEGFGAIINAQTNVLLERLKKLNELNAQIESQYYAPEVNPILNYIREGDGDWQLEEESSNQ